MAGQKGRCNRLPSADSTDTPVSATPADASEKTLWIDVHLDTD